MKAVLVAALTAVVACTVPIQTAGPPEASTSSNSSGSYFDRQQRSTLLRTTRHPTLLAAMRTPRACTRDAMPEPVGFLDLPSFYGDPAGYAKADAPLREFQNFVTQMAESYVLTRDSAYAHCVAAVLNNWADRKSLLDFRFGNDHRQSWYNAVWTTVSAAFAYSVVRDEPTLAVRTARSIDAWLGKITRKHLGLTGGRRACCNNHAHWRGLEAAMVGAATGDRELLMNGTRAYRSALQSMNADGSFPHEMERGDRAIHYQNFAILPLVYIAEIADRQELDLYNSAVNGKTLHDAIRFLLGAIENPAVVRKYTDRVQDLSFLNGGSELNWMEPYNRRFHKERIASMLAPRRPIIHRYGGGNSTLYFFSPER